ncbi:hypothetical protein E6O75_ATG05979 [Venturia nashicola]|uniref:Uncharacterized protein n=1 Tax=Venturia nashicola TaxID=86259 RepID=A0A4Z1NYZ0_9PEZI|nr:hypothetical protein E6O75_ATG05979 [Venturia nashicola]
MPQLEHPGIDLDRSFLPRSPMFGSWLTQSRSDTLRYCHGKHEQLTTETVSLTRLCLPTQGAAASRQVGSHVDEDQTPRTNFPEYPIEALPSHRMYTEQTIAGGMSYAEFTNLDGKDIQAIEARISEFGKHLDVLRLSYSYTQAPSGHPVPNEAENIPKVENADVDPAALDYESVKAMLLELNSMLKIEAEKH